MKRTALLCFMAVVLLVAVLVLAACTTTTTITFTRTRPIPTTPLIMPPEGNLTAEDAPLSPHAISTIETCDICHQIVIHLGTETFQEVCPTCHKEGPQILEIERD
jgi:hypothetical protein